MTNKLHKIKIKNPLLFPFHTIKTSILSHRWPNLLFSCQLQVTENKQSKSIKFSAVFPTCGGHVYSLGVSLLLPRSKRKTESVWVRLLRDSGAFHISRFIEMTQLVRDQTSSNIKVSGCWGTICFIMYSESVAYATELGSRPNLGARL